MVSVGFKAEKALMKKIKSKAKGAEKAEKATIGDFRSRAPAWVSAEVVKTYNIKKSEITPERGKTGEVKAGEVRLKGKTVGSAALIYKGCPLTPARFGMTPKVPKPSYTLKVEILKGQKKTLGKVKKLTKKQQKNIGRNLVKQGTQNSPRSPIMLMPTGAKSKDKVQFIPLRRVRQVTRGVKGAWEKPATLSMPQMITNPKVAERINAKINEEMTKRLTHNMGRYMGK